MSEDKKIIFSMVGLSKSFENNKQILKDIYLSFFYGAKIGIIGLNGSGKSTLLKIIAGIDKSFQGEVNFSDGYKIGYLEQEPTLDDTKKVIDIVKEGMKESVEVMEAYNAINDAFSNSESSLADTLGKKPIENLTTSIGVNEKFLYTNNLFNGSAEDFNEQIHFLNEQNSLTIAMDYLHKTLVQKYNWNTKSKQVKKFIDLIERRYM